MKAYLQELDTVNFSQDNIQPGILDAKITDTKVRVAIYSVFYEIALSPNQAIDLLVLRRAKSEASLSSLPFSFHLDKVHTDTPFTNFLLAMLKRGGKKAFIFSSEPDSISKAREWGQLIISEGARMDDKALLSAAIQSAFYPHIVEWARQLDAESSTLKINLSIVKPSYYELFRDYFETQEAFTTFDFLEIQFPENRSETYSAIDSLSIPSSEKQKRKEIPNLISNISYAMETESKLIISESSPFEFIVQERSPEILASLYIDLKGLLSNYPELEDAIKNSAWKKIGEARYKAHPAVIEGWSFLAKGEKS